jgi:hypothetical protein
MTRREAENMPDRSQKTATFTMGAWYNAETGHIHLAIPDSGWFITTVSNEPSSRRYHPNLYRKLARALKESGVPHPDVAHRTAAPNRGGWPEA